MIQGGALDWPAITFLPLKRYVRTRDQGDIPQFGFLHIAHGLKVFLNERMPTPFDVTPVNEDLANNNFIQYENIQTLQEDGWTVD